MFKFIHTADVHLGSILNFGDDYVKNAVYNAFNKIVDYAQQEMVDFIVISGDLFDRDVRSIKAIKFFKDCAVRLMEKNISIYLIAGNHDYLLNKREVFQFPSNVFICDSENLSKFQVKNKEGKLIANILGQSYKKRSEGRKLYENYIAEDDGLFNMGLLHTLLDKNNLDYAPCSLENLSKNKAIAYWALGHIHKYKVLKNDEQFIAYSGIPQGRDFGETGVCGCILVEVDDENKIQTKFLPTASIIWKVIEVHIDEDADNIPGNISELISYIVQKGMEILDETNVRGYAVKWIIKGRTQLIYTIEEAEDNVEQLIIAEINKAFEDFNPFIYTVSIDIRLEKPIKKVEELMKENNTFKEIYDICEGFSKDRKQFIKSFGQIFESKFDMENLDLCKIQLDEDTYDVILSKAKEMIAEALLERED